VYGGAEVDDEQVEELDGRNFVGSSASAGQVNNDKNGLSIVVDGLQEPAQVHGSRAASPMGMIMPAAGMNPDELLAAYAAARAQRAPTSGTTTPSIAQSIDNAHISPSPSTLVGEHLRPSSAVGSVGGDRNPFRQSMVSDASRYSAAEESHK